MVQFGMTVVQCWHFFFFFDIAFLPVLSLDLKQPLQKLFFAVIENQKEVQHNDTVKIIPCMDGALMDINPPLMTRVLPVSLYVMSNAFLVQCSANFIVSGQFLNSVLGEFPFSLLEVFWGMQ